MTMTSAFKQPGDTLDLTAPYARSAGQGALVGSALFGVAATDIANGDVGPFVREGVFSLAKTAAQAWTIGDRIYWDAANKVCDNTPVGPMIGHATETAANPSSTGIVALCESVSLVPQTAIADVATADGSDAATTQALANALKSKLNTLLAELRTAGVLKP